MWARRAITLPLLVVVTVLWSSLLPVTLALAGIVDLVRGGPWPLVRCVAFLTIYLVCEVAGVTAAAALWLVSGPWIGAPRARFLGCNVALQAWWANVLYRGVERVFGVRTIVEGEDAIVPGPILVFIRHVSQADTLLPADLVGGALVSATIRVRFWRVPAAQIPAEDDARIRWLYEHWQSIDDWIAEVHPPSG